MQLLIDADGCPVVRLACAIAGQLTIPVALFCDSAHEFNLNQVETVTVSKGADSADFALIQRVQPGDVVVTQDYGLAAMVLAKNGVALDQDGRIYRPENIDMLLYTRHLHRQGRRQGQHMKGPKKRRPVQNDQFAKTLTHLLTQKETL